jgi:anti-sigma factor RsiW
VTAPSVHEMYEQLAVGHALHALEPADELEFLTHLPSCSTCLRDLAEHRDTLAQLAYAAEPIEPPASLLEGIRAGVAASGRAGAFPAPVLSLEQARERRKGRTMRVTTALLGAAASLVLVAALLFVNRGLQSENTRIQARDSALQGAVGSLVLADSHQVNLSGVGGARAVAVLNKHDVSLVVQGLPSNDKAHSVYVLWQRSTFGVVRAVGTFDVSASPVSVVTGLHLTGDSADISRLVVTQERGRVAPALAKGAPVVEGNA